MPTYDYCGKRFTRELSGAELREVPKANGAAVSKCPTCGRLWIFRSYSPSRLRGTRSLPPEPSELVLWARADVAADDRGTVV
jgi:hypothetical protein